MGISKKGKRKIIYQEKEYFWWVKEDLEYFCKPFLHIISPDKELVLSYGIGEGDFFVISGGRVFQGKPTSGRWEYYRYSFKDGTPPMVVTPAFVRELIAWAVDGRGAETVPRKKPEEGCLYRLILCDNEMSYENYREEFDIGIFSSRGQAERLAEHYLNHVQGFKDYNCSYRIVQKQRFGGTECSDVYMVYAWNENEYGDEVDIIESECFADELAAKKEMARLKQIYARSEWCLSRYRIGEWKWRDGFVRV